MNILFMSLLDFDDIQEHNIYTDLLREFCKSGHSICCISPIERKKKQKTKLIQCGTNVKILKLQIGNVQKTNFVEKGISTLAIEPQFIYGIKKYFSDEKFDMVLYTTPPITLLRAVNYVKRRDKAFAYLMLKDIFPQNAVDIGMLSKTGVKGVLYWYFRNKEKKLYRGSDYIGCMSQANVNYVKVNNSEIEESKIGLCPNCIEPMMQYEVSKKDCLQIRRKFGIPQNSIVLVYGGNLGRPQGITFMIDCIKSATQIPEVFFLIIGSGTEYSFIEKKMQKEGIHNAKLIQYMPKEEYDNLLRTCDIGLIFLDYRFKIPNFPSRLLGYLDAGLPILAATDLCTDVGMTIVDGKFGWWCESRSIEDYIEVLERIVAEQKKDKHYLKKKGKVAREYLEQYYDVKMEYKSIISQYEKHKAGS